MKRHKVDIENLPTDAVLAINEWGDILFGTLYIDDEFPKVISCQGPRGYWKSHITHYILKSDLLNLPEE